MNEVTSKEAVSYIYQSKAIYENNRDTEDFFVQLSTIDDEEAKRLILEMFNSDCAENTKQKGDSLETLVNYLLDKSGMFQRLRPDIRFNYCQVDHYGIFKPEVWVFMFGSYKGFNEETNAFLGESKRYGDTLGVTYVLKFECVKHVRDIKFGVYFTRKGITGRDYTDSNAVIKKLYDKDRQFSIVFKDDDWQKIKEKPKSFGYLFCKKVFDFLDCERL